MPHLPYTTRGRGLSSRLLPRQVASRDRSLRTKDRDIAKLRAEMAEAAKKHAAEVPAGGAFWTQIRGY